MVSLRRPPTFIPSSPCSQPEMTWPEPSVTSSGCLPRSHEASNCLLLSYSTPTYCTESLSPFLAAAPLPTTRSSTLSCFGAAPVDFGIFGFLERSRSPAVGVIFVAVGAASACCETGFWVFSCDSAVRANWSAVLSSALPPQPLSRSVRAASAAGIPIFVVIVVAGPRAQPSAGRKGTDRGDQGPRIRTVQEIGPSGRRPQWPRGARTGTASWRGKD